MSHKEPNLPSVALQSLLLITTVFYQAIGYRLAVHGCVFYYPRRYCLWGV